MVAVLLGASLGVLLLFAWAADAWPSFFVVENRLGPAECRFDFGDDEVWSFSVAAGESAQKFFPFGPPRDWHWRCETSAGFATGSTGGCGIFSRDRRRHAILKANPVDASGDTFTVVC